MKNLISGLILVMAFSKLQASAIIAERWIAVEITLTSDITYSDPFNDVEVTGTFTGPNGKTIICPAFWDGNNVWRIRFALTAIGNWKLRTTCSDVQNKKLQDAGQKIICVPYKGSLEIYRRGFIKVTPGNRYFTYDDDKPFFYLGDTHWSMPAEMYDSSSVREIPSQFRYIVDKRVMQGFTVFQSEPIGTHYELADGFSEKDLEGFRDLDRRFQYIAQNGLVHANAQIMYATILGEKRSSFPKEYLEKLSRYWVARYAAYPVLWTTAQEVDKDMYSHRLDHGKDMNPWFDSVSNPWKIVFNAVHQYDPYHHPQTAHQEFASLKGDGTAAFNSSFKNLTGYTWMGAQWSPAKNAQLDFDIAKDFWNNNEGRPVVNYEGHYDHLWTNEFGARLQGWTAYLNGMCGIGYGAADIWLINSTYDMAKETVNSGITISIEDKKIPWNKSVELKSAYQLGYMKKFFETVDWWKLQPRFNDISWFQNDSSFFSLATMDNKIYVAYFYNKTRNTGTLLQLANRKYSKRWFNPRSGQYENKQDVVILTNRCVIGDKPDENDWVLVIE